MLGAVCLGNLVSVSEEVYLSRNSLAIGDLIRCLETRPIKSLASFSAPF